MANLGYTPALGGFARTFLIDGRARPDHTPVYKACMKVGAPSQDFGDVEDIKCPDPNNYNQWIVIGELQGDVGRATADVMSRYASDEESLLLSIARRRCPIDVQVHFGKCTDPSAFNTFTKALVFENALISNWSADELGTLSSDENAAINETASISSRSVYEILPLTFGERCADVVTNPVVDVVICDTQACAGGGCTDESDGCEKIFALADSGTGSPGTGPDVIWSINNFSTCNSDEITTMDSSEDGNAIACFGDNVLVVSHDTDSIHYKGKAEIWAGDFGGWTEIATGIVAAGSPLDMWSVGDYVFIVGDGGYVYGSDNPTTGVDVLDAGVATAQNLNAVHALDSTFAVAVGAANAVIYTSDGASWQAVTGPNAGVVLNCVWLKSETEWFVGCADGTLWYTVDTAENWAQITLPGQGSLTAITDIQFASASVGFLSATYAGPLGRIYRSYDGGYSWQVLPESVGSMPASDLIAAIAACENDVNFVVGVGTADNGTDGFIVTGND